MHHYSSSRGQRIFILFIIFLLPIFLFREYKLLSEKKSGVIITENTYYETHPRQPVHHHFTIIVPVLDGGLSLTKNIDSIASQDYDSFQVEYLLVEPREEVLHELTAHRGALSGTRSMAIHTVADKSALFQKYIEVIQRCENDTVVVHLRGSDWFSHSEVLSSLDTTYQNQDVWLTYSQYIDFPTMKQGKTKPHGRGRYYGKRVHRAPWVTSRCKTFYARLFKEHYNTAIHETSFTYVADTTEELHAPIADIGKMHVRFIPEALYIRADAHATKKHGMTASLHVEACCQTIAVQKAKKPRSTPACDAVVFSYKTPERLEAFLQAAATSIDGLGDVFIFYQEKTAGEYAHLQKAYRDPVFLDVTGLQGEELIETLAASLQVLSQTNRYLLISHDGATLSKRLPLLRDIERLKQARASALYYHLGVNEAVHDPFGSSLRFAATRFCGDGYYTWNLRKGKHAFKYPDTLTCTLYATRFAARMLQEQVVHSLDELFAQERSAVHGVGMFNIDSATTSSL